MTDAEVVCTFMEAKPDARGASLYGKSSQGWWQFIWMSKTQPRVTPRPLTLNECHEVESRLTREQWVEYRSQFREMSAPRESHEEYLINLSAEHKIRALSAVLRGSVPICGDSVAVGSRNGLPGKGEF